MSRHRTNCECVACCDRDVMRDGNTLIHQAERHEHLSALAVMSETERVQACGHYWVKGSCIYCSETIDWGDV